MSCDTRHLFNCVFKANDFYYLLLELKDASIRIEIKWTSHYFCGRTDCLCLHLLKHV